jgi:alpha-beta hydrolase superfamily lysophospholipase
LSEADSLVLTEQIRRREGQVELVRPDASVADSGPAFGERYCYAWLPPEPDRVLVLIHGYAEHAGRYDEMAIHFARRGFAVHAYDQIGHGRTKGARGHVDRFDRLTEEVARFVDLVRLEHPGLPVVLVGHSMGGLVVAGTAVFQAPAVERIVLSGALLDLNSAGGLRQKLSLVIARVLSVIAPRIGLAAGLDLEGLSRDPEVIRRYEADPNVKDRMSARFAAGMSAMVGSVAAAASRVAQPVLILHGADDSIAPPDGSKQFHAGLAPEVARESALTIYPELRHEIFNEPEREAVWQDILNWLDSPVERSARQADLQTDQHEPDDKNEGRA